MGGAGSGRDEPATKCDNVKVVLNQTKVGRWNEKNERAEKG